MILPRGGETTCIKRKLSSSWEILKEPLRGTNFLFCGRDSSRFTRKRSRLKTITSRHIFWSECHKMYRKRYDELPRPFCMGVPTRPSFVAETIFLKRKMVTLQPTKNQRKYVLTIYYRLLLLTIFPCKK